MALVTGASRGLGASMARALARAGAHVALHASRLEPADLAAAIASEHGVRTASFVADLAIRTETASLVPRTLERFGRLDVLVNNAGMIRRADARDFSDDDWDTGARGRSLQRLSLEPRRRPAHARSRQR